MWPDEPAQVWTQLFEQANDHERSVAMVTAGSAMYDVDRRVDLDLLVVSRMLMLRRVWLRHPPAGPGINLHRLDAVPRRAFAGGDR